jgi:hypothetical protein
MSFNNVERCPKWGSFHIMVQQGTLIIAQVSPAGIGSSFNLAWEMRGGTIK